MILSDTNKTLTPNKACMRDYYSKYGEKGFTLLEVLVAITILLLVILPLASLYVKSLTTIQNAALYSQAIQIAQERMEVCSAENFGGLNYFNENFAPGFPFQGPLPASHQYDGSGASMNNVGQNAYDNRDNPDTTPVEWYFDPTDSNAENYPVPVYRDYYNNYTGLLLDPNFNGLCDDDLDGDDEAGILADGGPDLEDIEIATNGLLRQYSDPEFSGTPAAALGSTWVPGDGLRDTVVEGNYLSSMDPMYRQVRIQESPSAILDYGLLFDVAHSVATPDYRHRETTFANMVRMTTFLDPTPTLANPNDVDTWVDGLYIRDMSVGGYSAEDIQKLRLCLNRDLPLYGGYSTWDVGVNDGGLVEIEPYNVNYATPIYGIRVIVTVFYLTGEGELELTDIDGDGTLEEVPMESYGGARRVRLERSFYNTSMLTGSSKSIPPPRRYILSTQGNAENPARVVAAPDIEDSGDDSDPCDLDHRGLPYLD